MIQSINLEDDETEDKGFELVVEFNKKVKEFEKTLKKKFDKFNEQPCSHEDFEYYAARYIWTEKYQCQSLKSFLVEMFDAQCKEELEHEKQNLWRSLRGVELMTALPKTLSMSSNVQEATKHFLQAAQTIVINICDGFKEYREDYNMYPNIQEEKQAFRTQSESGGAFDKLPQDFYQYWNQRVEKLLHENIKSRLQELHREISNTARSPSQKISPTVKLQSENSSEHPPSHRCLNSNLQREIFIRISFILVQLRREVYQTL